MPYDKRKLERVDRFLIVEFKQLKKTAAHAVGITKDLSCEGFSIESQSFDFGHGEVLEFILKHPVGDMSVTVLGEVVWKKQGWYKYVAGIKFHEVTEETKSEVARLISALDDMPDEPAPAGKDSAGEAAESNEEEIMPDRASGFRDMEIKKDKVSQPDTVQTTLDDISAVEKDRKKKSRVYIPIAAILFFISVVAVIVIIDMHNKELKSVNSVVTESGIKSEAIPQGLSAVEVKKIKKPEPDPKKEKIPKAVPVVRPEKVSGNEVVKKIAKPKKPKHAVGAKKTVKAKVRAKSKKAVKIETAAKNKKPLKTKPAEKAEAREKPQKTVPVVKPPKFPEIALIVRHKKPQKIQDGSITEKSKFANAVLSVKWKKIGSAKNRTPLFIDTETISYPSEHIVNFSMKASVNKKEFIELLEIDCSQIKLRIMEEPLEKIPVLTPYSIEWRDIIPGSMLLYEAVCSKRNRR